MTTGELGPMTAAPTPIGRLWHRSLDRYPSNRARYLSLGIVVATTIVLYYQLYLSGGVATAILRGLHMSFTYYVNISVIGYLLGAAASWLAGLADRYGRANIVTVGLAVVGLLCLVGLPNAHSKLAFLILYAAIGFVEGIILVATPALIRDFSPQLGRASAMGFWTLGPVLGSLVVAAFVSGAGNRSWQDQYRISGVIGLVVFVVALIGLRELSPRLRDQLMVSRKDRELIEARAAGIDIEAVAAPPVPADAAPGHPALGVRDQRVPDHLLRRGRVLPGVLRVGVRLQPVPREHARRLVLGVRRRWTAAGRRDLGPGARAQAVHGVRRGLRDRLDDDLRPEGDPPGDLLLDVRRPAVVHRGLAGASPSPRGWRASPRRSSAAIRR